MFPRNGGIWPRTAAVVAAIALAVGLAPELATASEASDPAPPTSSIGKGVLVDGNGVIFPIVEELPGARIVTTPCAVEIVYEEGRYLD